MVLKTETFSICLFKNQGMNNWHLELSMLQTIHGEFPIGILTKNDSTSESNKSDISEGCNSLRT